MAPASARTRGPRTRAASVGPGQHLIFRESGRAGAGLRRPPRRRLSRRLLRSLSPAARARTRHARRATSTSTASRTSSIRTAAACCSRSSTRCAACAIRCTRARSSIAIRSRPTARMSRATRSRAGRCRRLGLEKGPAAANAASVRVDPLDHALLAQRGDGLLVVAEPGQDLVGVLAQRRARAGGWSRASPTATPAPWRSARAWARPGYSVGWKKPIGLDVRIVERLLRLEHGPRGDLGLGQDLQRLGGRCARRTSGSCAR